MDKFKVQQTDSKISGTPAGRQIVARDMAIIQGLVGKDQAAGAQQAIKAVHDAAGAGIEGDAATLPGLGVDGTLSVTGNRHDGTSTYTLPGMGLPSPRDLASQDGDSPTTTHSQDGSGDSNRGPVWVERRTERSSADGTHTWGSATYRDMSGNFWRSDYQIDRNEDGGTTSKDTVYDNHNEPIKTTVVDTAPDGTEKVTTTDHQTGQTTTTVGQVKPEESPEEENPEGGDTKNQGETTGLASGPFRPKKLTSPNKVNPGPDGGGQQPLAPVRFDRSILVTDPAPDNTVASRGATPTDIPAGNINQNTIDPPRPQ